MHPCQAGLLEPLPAASRYVTFALRPDVDPTAAFRALQALTLSGQLVVGIGAAVAARLGKPLAGLRTAPELVGPGAAIPSTPGALWGWLRGEDRGQLLHAERELRTLLAPAFTPLPSTEGFLHRGGRDLSGYVDGTENPQGQRAVEAAVVTDAEPAGMHGSSFVAVQRWRHDLDTFASFPPAEQDNIIGRTQAEDIELDDAPASAHVKRTAQEDFEPEAFVLRRSMPWSDGTGEGLVFIAFGRTLDAFEAQLRRMVGLDDGIADALFRFTQPETSAYYWCPPAPEGRLELSALGL